MIGLGYQSVYLQRPNRQDGCLIAFQRKKFHLHAVDEVIVMKALIKQK
jgi:hypothetical protein